MQLLIRAAIDGVGVTFLMEEQATPYLANGRLVRVLDDWCEPVAGYSSAIRAAAKQPAAGRTRSGVDVSCRPLGGWSCRERQAGRDRIRS